MNYRNPITPPPHQDKVDGFKRSSLVSALILAASAIPFASLSHANILNTEMLGDDLSIVFNNGTSNSFNGIDIDIEPPSAWNYFSVTSEGLGTQLNIDGKTSFTSYTTGPEGQDGTYAFHAKNGGIINLNGDVNLRVTHTVSANNGADGIYASGSGSSINIGTANSQTIIWVLAPKPDSISAKGGGQVTINSTNNQIVGSLDTYDSSIFSPGRINATFSGSESYWFGDEQSLANSYTVGRMGPLVIPFEPSTTSFNTLIFSDGAQWSYLGIQSTYGAQGGSTGASAPKRIVEIELNGGIVNLYDEDLKNKWQEIGLWELLNKETPYTVKHDYVRIGKLHGSGGIFRLDLTAEDKTQSDLIYIEDGDDEDIGTHFIEPYNLEALVGITPTNTLTFALVNENSSIKFTDKQNFYGESLVDYELEIDSSKINAKDLENLQDSENAYWDKTADVGNSTDEEKAVKIDMSMFENGTNWFIKRITLRESAAALGMTGAGYASYDAVVEMDRHDRRLHETVRDAEDPDNGLWVRMHHGRSGAENEYRWDRTGVTIGFDRALGTDNRAGAWFSYTEGDTEFLDVRGDGDMKRYEFALYDTLTLGNHYLDFVGRIGRVSSDFTVGNRAYTTSGDFDQDYAAVSAEYGYTLKSPTGVFVEPQLQFQVAYLDSYDYTARGMKVEADSETSAIGRIGFRAGRAFQSTDAAGEIYFRGDVLHQFTDGQDAELSDATRSIQENWGDTGTWADIGIGTAWNWKNRFVLQLDAERVMGGKTDDTWLLSGRFNYLF